MRELGQRCAGEGAPESSSWAGGKNAAGDGAGLFPHLAFVLLGGYVPQIHGGIVKDSGEARGRRGLAYERARD